MQIENKPKIKKNKQFEIIEATPLLSTVVGSPCQKQSTISAFRKPISIPSSSEKLNKDINRETANKISNVVS